jgi:hypothetical protein
MPLPLLDVQSAGRGQCGKRTLAAPLPALPLKIVDGKLAVAKPFIGRPTFQQM